MKKQKILLTVTLLFAIVTASIGQHDALVRHWSFDNDISAFQNISNTEINSFSLNKGVSGKGLTLSDNYLEIKDGVDLMNDFTLSFWFKPEQIEVNQTLFYQ